MGSPSDLCYEVTLKPARIGGRQRIRELRGRPRSLRTAHLILCENPGGVSVGGEGPPPAVRGPALGHPGAGEGLGPGPDLENWSVFSHGARTSRVPSAASEARWGLAHPQWGGGGRVLLLVAFQGSQRGVTEVQGLKPGASGRSRLCMCPPFYDTPQNLGQQRRSKARPGVAQR